MKHDALKQLETAYQQASKRKYPNVPDQVKMMNDKQSRAQKTFQAEVVEASGGKYFIVRSLDEFMRHYRSLVTN